MLKKGLSIAGRVLTILLLIFAVFVMVFTVISVSTVGKADADFLGFKPNIVLSDSMQDTFAVGDLEVSRKVDPESLAAGDIITFRSIDPANYGSVITHKIREITTYEGGLAFVTYGTTTGVDDAYPVPADKVLGKYVFRTASNCSSLPPIRIRRFIRRRMRQRSRIRIIRKAVWFI